jgi:hypothetical protein
MRGRKTTTKEMAENEVAEARSKKNVGTVAFGCRLNEARWLKGDF